MNDTHETQQSSKSRSDGRQKAPRAESIDDPTEHADEPRVDGVHPEYAALELTPDARGLWGPGSLPSHDVRGRSHRLARTVGVVAAAQSVDCDAREFARFLLQGDALSTISKHIFAFLDDAERDHGIVNPKATVNLAELLDSKPMRDKLDSICAAYGETWRPIIEGLLRIGIPMTKVEAHLVENKGAKKLTEQEIKAAHEAVVAKFSEDEMKFYKSLKSDELRHEFAKFTVDERHAILFDRGLREDAWPNRDRVE